MIEFLGFLYCLTPEYEKEIYEYPMKYVEYNIKESEEENCYWVTIKPQLNKDRKV